MEKTTFDIEMKDYDEAEDVTTVRITKSDDNSLIATANVAFGGNGDIETSLIDLENVSLERAIESAIKAEFEAHASNHEIETLRDLLAVVVPSGQF